LGRTTVRESVLRGRSLTSVRDVNCVPSDSLLHAESCDSSDTLPPLPLGAMFSILLVSR
jgi:hypothetical protein